MRVHIIGLSLIAVLIFWTQNRQKRVLPPDFWAFITEQAKSGRSYTENTSEYYTNAAFRQADIRPSEQAVRVCTELKALMDSSAAFKARMNESVEAIRSAPGATARLPASLPADAQTLPACIKRSGLFDTAHDARLSAAFEPLLAPGNQLLRKEFVLAILENIKLQASITQHDLARSALARLEKQRDTSVYAIMWQFRDCPRAGPFELELHPIAYRPIDSLIQVYADGVELPVQDGIARYSHIFKKAGLHTLRLEARQNNPLTGEQRIYFSSAQIRVRPSTQKNEIR